MSTRILSQGDLAQLMTPIDYISAVEQGFRMSKMGLTHAPMPMHIEGVGGAFHAKGAAWLGPRKVVAVKLNGNFPGNPNSGRPTIQGVIILCDAENGAVLALMDSIEVTLRRTAAASALAAKHSARANAGTLAIVGCGAQAVPHAQAITAILPIKHIVLWDIDAGKAMACAQILNRLPHLQITLAANMADATRASEVIVTCTTSRVAFLSPDDVSPGAFIAAVGADNAEKSEITPALMAKSTVITDVLAQCAMMGDLHHALAAGTVTQADVYAELQEIVVGDKLARRHANDIIIFDSTGTAIQDVASAALIYTRACEKNYGTSFSFSDDTKAPTGA